jgi:hypothetical protein
MNTWIIDVWNKPGYEWTDGTETIVTQAETLAGALDSILHLESIYEDMWDEPNKNFKDLPINFRAQMVAGPLNPVLDEDIKRELEAKLDKQRKYVMEGLAEEKAQEAAKAEKVAELRKLMAESGITTRDLEP